MAGAVEPLSVPRRIAFAGDWHMSAEWAEDAILHARDAGADVIIHTGDFAYRFHPLFLLIVGQTLEETGLQLLFVDGNHDDVRWLDTQPLHHNGLRLVHPRIWHLPRGFRWTWDGIRFLALGGAHSVNRPHLLHRGLMWQEEETITTAQAIRAAAGGPVDVMVTHDCPAGVTIPGVDDRTGPAPFPAEEIARSDRHRKLLGGVVDTVRPGVLWHGHYHTAYAQQVDLGWSMLVVGLDKDGTSMAHNLAVVDLEELRPGSTEAAGFRDVMLHGVASWAVDGDS